MLPVNDEGKRMTEEPRGELSGRNMTGRVLAFSLGLATFGAPFAWIASQYGGGALPIRIPVVLLLALFVVAAAAPFNLEVGRNGFALSLTEMPLVLGLLGTGRVGLIAAGTFGYLVSKVPDRKVARLKLAFNVPLAFLELSVSTVIFDRVDQHPLLTAPTTWLALLLSLAASTVLSTTAVNIVIAATGDSLDFSQALRHTFLGIANTILALGLTLIAIILLQETIASIALIALLAAVVVGPLRRYATLQRRFSSLQSLHEFTAGLTRSKDLTTTLQSATSQCARILRAESSEIILRPAKGSVVRTKSGNLNEQPQTGETAPKEGDQVWQRVLTEGKPVRFSRDDKRAAIYLAQNELKDLMAVPLCHNDDVIGILIVRNRLGDVSSFDENDLSILLTMADQTTITLQNMRLITRLRDEAASREHQALHDHLTGLPNRASLALAIQDGIDRSDGIEKFAVLLLDLNRFKEVNDTMGHHAGDQVLIDVSKRLSSALPQGATIARLGGDEFAVTVPDVRSVDQACAVAERFQKTFVNPFVLDGMALRLDASIGVSVFPDDGLDASTLLRRADVAMYAAKAEKGPIIRRYDPSQEHSTTRQLKLVADLRDAVEREDIDVHFQPKASLLTGVMVGVEALARWKHPTFGAVSPDEFIPLAEQAGFISSLTDIVLRKSLELSSRWYADDTELSVAVNLEIDRSFVGDADESRRHAAIVRAVTDIAGSLGLTTVAEGVEDQTCWDALLALGCDVAQGWHLSRPMSSTDLLIWHSQRRQPRTELAAAAAVAAASPALALAVG